MKYPDDFINKVIQGDCLEVMKDIPDNSIDLIVTDPPYNIGDSNKRTKQGNKIVSNIEAWGEWDNMDEKEFDLFFINYLKECYRILKNGGSIYCFSARKDNGYFVRKAVEIGFKYLNTLAIIKDNPLPHFTKTNWRSSFELCFYMCKGNRPKTFNFLTQDIMINKYHYFIGKKFTCHPTEKPLGFFELLIRVSSNKNEIIFDGFLGSGTTAVACKMLNRKFIGVELSEKYCKIAKERLSKVPKRLDKFASDRGSAAPNTLIGAGQRVGEAESGNNREKCPRQKTNSPSEKTIEKPK